MAVHCAFDLPSERFSHFGLTDESEGERLDRIPVVKGEIRLADRAYLAAERIAATRCAARSKAVACIRGYA